jgi:hypothetical protein
MQPRPKRPHDRIVDLVEEWFEGYDFMVLKSYSIPIMETNTAILLSFGEQDSHGEQSPPERCSHASASHRQDGRTGQGARIWLTMGFGL